MIIKTADELHQIVRKILLAAGADERNANCVAEHLVSANLSGVELDLGPKGPLLRFGSLVKFNTDVPYLREGASNGNR